MTRNFYQSHECAGYRCKITVEWSAPEGIDELDINRMEKAEELAAEMISVVGPKTYEIVQAMCGFSKGR